MKKNWRVTISVIIMVVFLFFLIKSITLNDIKILFENFKFSFLILATPFYLLTYFLKTERFRVLLDKKINYWNLFGIVSIHNLFVNILPARIGEISYIKMIDKKEIKLSKNLKSLVLARLMDLIVIIFLFMILFNFSNVQLESYLFYIALMVFLILILILLIPRYSLVILKELSKILFRRKSGLNKRLNKFILELEDEIKNTKGALLFKVFFITLLIWLFGFLFNYILLIGLGIQLGPLDVFLIVSVLVFITMIPIAPPGGIGAIEGVWATGLFIYGISKEIAIIAGFYIHIVQLILTLLFGLVGVLIFKKIN